MGTGEAQAQERVFPTKACREPPSGELLTSSPAERVGLVRGTCCTRGWHDLDRVAWVQGSRLASSSQLDSLSWELELRQTTSGPWNPEIMESQSEWIQNPAIVGEQK